MTKVCIVGAGSSGLVTAKILIDKGVDFDCFEKSDRIGGNWAFKNPNGMSSAYRSLHINTSRYVMAYSDFPMPEDYPDFPHHTLVQKYFEDYVNHFGVRERITFNCAVEHCERLEDGRWRVRLQTGDIREYDALIVANGHHWDSHYPNPPFPGSFDGDIIHSHNYIDPTDPVNCVGKNVVVVGMGNSALDIACELGHPVVSENVYLAIRRGYYITPKYFGSKTLDASDTHPSQDSTLLERLTPGCLQRWRRLKWIREIVGRPEDYGLPRPEYPYGQTHPTISNEIFIRLGSGDVKPMPNIQEFRGGKIAFTDGREVDVEVVIYATGYNITFPFFDPDFLSAPNNDLPLFHRVIHPKHHNLFFIGFVQPLCAIMPLAEEQAKWVVALLAGEYALPSQAQMETETRGFHEGIKQRYLSSPRHTIQVPDCSSYTYNMRKELKRGRRRAARAA